MLTVNECKTVYDTYGYWFEICRDAEGYMIMRFNYAQYGLNLSSDKVYKSEGSCIAAAKNICNAHFKRNKIYYKFKGF